MNWIPDSIRQLAYDLFVNEETEQTDFVVTGDVEVLGLVYHKKPSRTEVYHLSRDADTLCCGRDTGEMMSSAEGKARNMGLRCCGVCKSAVSDDD